MKLPPKIVIIVTFLISLSSFSQPQKSDFKILFYNTENLFDATNDTLIDDEEYLPGSNRVWTYKRFQDKLNNIAKVIIAAGGWETPGIVGFCEVENRYVVEQLLRKPPLEKTKYRIIHKESPDKRGIDVSLIYDERRFKPIRYDYYPVIGIDGFPLSTREILYVAGTIGKTSDTIHLLVNHWPSRTGGILETKNLREQAAKTLAGVINTVLKENFNPRIIVMGDFNDQPTDESIARIVGKESGYPIGKRFLNLSGRWDTKNFGTIKYQGQWSVFDQIIVSENLLDSTKNISCRYEDAHILNNDFLLEKDRQYNGVKPFRTYSGYNYLGGFSDHLPVYLDLFFRKP